MKLGTNNRRVGTRAGAGVTAYTYAPVDVRGAMDCDQKDFTPHWTSAAVRVSILWPLVCATPVVG